MSKRYFITDENLQKISPAVGDAYNNLIEALKKHKIDIGVEPSTSNGTVNDISTLAYCLTHDYTAKFVDKSIFNALLVLEEQFKLDTEVEDVALELDLEYNYYGTGAVWSVVNVEIVSPPGKRFDLLLSSTEYSGAIG